MSKHRELENGPLFVHKGFTKCNIFSEGSIKPEKYTQVFQ